MDGLILFKNNIFIIATLGIVACAVVLFRYQMLRWLDIAHHRQANIILNDFILSNNNIFPEGFIFLEYDMLFEDSIYKIFTLFDDYYSAFGRLHLDMVILEYLTQLVLIGLILCGKILVITKSLLLLNNKDSSVKSVYGMVKSNSVRMKKVGVTICLIEISPIFLSKILSDLFWKAELYYGFTSIFGSRIFEELLYTVLMSRKFLACALVLTVSIIVSYMICHIITEYDSVFKKSLFMIKLTFRKLIVLFLLFYGIYGLTDYMFTKLSFLIFQKTGQVILPVQAMWGFFDIFTVALLFLQVTILVTVFIRFHPQNNINRFGNLDIAK